MLFEVILVQFFRYSVCLDFCLPVLEPYRSLSDKTQTESRCKMTVDFLLKMTIIWCQMKEVEMLLFTFRAEVLLRRVCIYTCKSSLFSTISQFLIEKLQN